MSHSVFKEFPKAASPSVFDNVVIVRNKDGSVTVDQNELHNFLRDDYGKTSVSVVRVQSPTPSLQEELQNSVSDEEAVSDIDGVFNSEEEAFEDEESPAEKEEEDFVNGDSKRQGKRPYRKKNRSKEKVPHVRLTVEQYLEPEDAKKFAAEILQYAGMTSALSLDIDYDFQRYVVQNDHCYTPLTSPSQREGHSSSAAEGSPATAPTNAKSGLKQTPGSKKQTGGVKAVRKSVSKEGSDSKSKQSQAEEQAEDSEDRAPEDEDDDEDFSPSESDNDRDSDLDFSVNDRGYPTKARRSVRKVANLSRQSNSRNTNSSLTSNTKETPTGFSSGTVKSIKKRHSNSNSITNRVEKAAPIGEQKSPVVTNKIKHVVVNSGKTPPIQKPSLPQPVKVIIEKTPPPAPIVSPVVHNHKKEKERQQVEALFSDMSSLFSTPDIIKKVNSTTTSMDISPKTDPPPLVLNKGFINTMATVRKSGPENIIVQQTIPSIPNTFELDLIDSIVKEEMGNSDVTKTVNLLNESFEAAEKTDLDLNDESLLEGITGDEGLPEELLQHVAELVENKHLQEVIDKQVLGVEDPMQIFNNVIKQPCQPVEVKEKESPFVKLAQQKQLAKQSAAAAASLTAPRKEPIKIVRSDGRVITLPPIEAPTTRGAKRRAQSTASTDSPLSGTPKSATGTPVPAKETKPVERKPETPIFLNLDEAMDKLKRKNSTTERQLSEVRTPKGSNSRRASTTPSVVESDMDDNWNSEDDPDRLWCICKQPHNNRFMICCDKCEDWFHGKCVNITKAMGHQMEQKGEEWRCPSCKEKSEKQNAAQLQSNLVEKSIKLVCIICKRLPPRANSVYCSDDCIARHSQDPSMKIVAKSNPSDDQAPKKIGVLKNKHDRVIVYNRETKQYLTGEKAPQLPNLKRWLQDNPHYDVVQPGSQLALAFKAKQAQLVQLSKDMALRKSKDQESHVPEQKVQTKLKLGTNKELTLVHPKTTHQIKTSTGKNSPTTEKPIQKVRKVSESRSTPNRSSSYEPEPIRINVRKTLKEQLSTRMEEAPETEPKLTDDEITQFALDVENEMFRVFNKDTGQKYKAKYRSLMFNIKDRKNHSLFQKICSRLINARQLVRMSPEELASQELAKWRENENKHQLEMITKSEMDLLACAKSIVMKTHKGEEVIESPISDRNIETVGDITMTSGSGILNEDSDLQATVTKYDMDKDRKLVSSSSSHNKKDKKERKRSRSRDRDGHHRHSSTSSSSKHHKRKKSRERSRDNKDKERDKVRHKSSSSSTHHSHHHHSSSNVKDKDKKTGLKDKLNQEPSSSPALSTSSSQGRTSEKKTPISTKDDEEAYNLIEKILKGTTPELIGKLHPNKVDAKEKINPSHIDPMIKSSEMSDLSPTSVHNKIIYTGSLNMIDVASIPIVAHPLSGDADDIQKHLPNVLDIVGRINPETVWEYLYKIKKSPNKEIVLLRFAAKSTNEQSVYETLYSYLEQKKRLGVIKNSSPHIKDIYLLPLEEPKSLPSVLVPISGCGFYDEDCRPNLLIGIIVRIRAKRPASSILNTMPAKASRKSVPIPGNKDDHYTPPSSPKTLSKPSKISLGLPKIATPNAALPLTPVQTKNDENEPYSPGGSDEDIAPEVPLIIPSIASSSLDPTDIQKKMEELNRQIEAQKQEIAVMLHQEIEGKPGTEKVAESSPTSIPILANISIPSNLHEILETIKNVGQPGSAGVAEKGMNASSKADDEDDEDEYMPIPGLEHPKGAVYKPASPSTMAFLLAQQQQTTEEIPFITKSTSKIAQMSEAELLSLVPDGVDIGKNTNDTVSEEPPPPGLEHEFRR